LLEWEVPGVTSRRVSQRDLHSVTESAILSDGGVGAARILTRVPAIATGEVKKLRLAPEGRPEKVGQDL